MNKTIIFLALAIIIILLVLFFINSNKTEAPTANTDTNQEEKNKNNNESMTSVEDGTYFVDTEKSEIKWTGRKTLIENWIDTGTINIKSGSLVINNESVESNQLIIDMSSISADTTGSGNGQTNLENHLKSADFFDIENYPTSSFTVTDIKKSAPNQFELTGDLTIKGITNEIIVPINAYQENAKYKITGATELDRTLWNIRFGSNNFFDNLGDNVIDDMITIDFEIWATKEA